MQNREQIRILQVLSSLDIGGAENRVMELYRHLDRSRYHFDFLVFQTGEPAYVREIEESGGRVYQLPKPSLRHVVSHFHQMRGIMKAVSYDVVHAHTSYHSGLVMEAAWLEHIPVRITHARTSGCHRDGFWVRPVVAFGKTLIWLFSTCRLAVSREAGEFLFCGNRYEILHDAIDLEKIQSCGDGDAAEQKRELCIPDDAFVIGQIARFDWIKYHEFTLKWFRHFKSEHENAFLVLLGDGPLKEQMISLAEELGISESVRFEEVRLNVGTLLVSLNVMLLPSRFEGLPGVILEAQACGIPSVISDTVTKEVDLGLNLVHRCSLDADFLTWDEAVMKARKIPAGNEEEIHQSFVKHGITLDKVLNRLMQEYDKGKA